MNDQPNGKITRVELEVAVDKLVELLPAQLKIYPLQAKAIRARYLSLLSEGFTEQQALEIVKSRPLWE